MTSHEIDYHRKIMGEYLSRYRSGFTEGWVDQFADTPNLVSNGDFTRPFRHGYEDGRTEAVLVMEKLATVFEESDDLPVTVQPDEVEVPLDGSAHATFLARTIQADTKEAINDEHLRQ